MKLVLASNNAKKLRELQALFAGLALELVAQSSLGIEEAEEPHLTFLENALAKARHASKASGLPAIADDSGLCVPLLGGQPGVQSAVYAGEVAQPCGAEREERRKLQDEANNQTLRMRMRSAIRQALKTQGSATAALSHAAPQSEEDLRRARFVCTLVAVRSADDPEPLVAFGRWEGVLLDEPRGEGGFGYDPYLFMPALGLSVAELDAEVKNRQSHRARAAAAMREQLAQALGLADSASR